MATMKNLVVMKLVNYDDDHFNLIYFDDDEISEEKLLEKDKNVLDSENLNDLKNKIKSLKNENILKPQGLQEKKIIVRNLKSNVSNQDKNLIVNEKIKQVKMKRTPKRNENSKLLLKNMLSKHFSTRISKNSVTIDNVRFSDYKAVLLFLTTNKIIKINESDLLKLKALFNKIKVPIKYMGKLARKILL